MSEQAFRGIVDGCNSNQVWGWALNEKNPNTPALVDILINGKKIRTIKADQFAPDLHVAGIGTGYHRWRCELESSDQISQGLNHVQVFFHGTNTELNNSPLSLMHSDLKFLRHVDPKAMLAAMYLSGTGIEIGALHHPLKVPEGVTVRYVDRMSVEDLRIHYSEMREYDLVPIDFVDNGEKLGTFESQSQDFVIANHFLEHCEDPIDTLINMTRVLRPDGILFITVPNKRATLDIDRDCTPMSHLIRDHEEGPAWSRLDHYHEWSKVLFKNESPQVQAIKAVELESQDYSIHFHVFNEFSIFELLALVESRYKLPLNVLQVVNNNNHETIFIAKRTYA